MDQCTHCTLRGNIDDCLSADCGHHDNWYAVEQQNEINRLRGALREIACLGNGSTYGNSTGNCMAIKALEGK